MRVYISADGEGISSLVNGAEMYPGAEYYEFGRKMMTLDVNAAVDAAFAAGATEVVVNDAHWTDLSILPLELDPRAQLLRGSGKPLSMMEGIDEGFDAALFVGYHARVGGSNGVANETVMGKQIYDVRINGASVGELAINAAIASHFGVPVVFVSGDDALAREAEAVLPDAEVAVVKYAINRWAARCLSPEAAHARIREGVTQALAKVKDGFPFRTYAFDKPLRCEVEFISTAQANAASVMPRATRVGFRTAAYEAEDILDAWRGLFSLMLLGCRATDEIYG